MTSESGTTLRDASPVDAVAVASAHGESWAVGYAELFPPDVIERGVAERCTVSKWEGIIESTQTGTTSLLLAWRNDAIAGLVQFGPDPEHPGNGFIDRLYLVPSAWGSGTAKLLMDAALNRLAANGLPTVRLWTAGTARARGFYGKAGFVESGVTRWFTLYSDEQIPEWEFIRVGW